MEAPAITRHRRPFLAPVWLLAAFALAAAGFALAAYRAAAATTVVIARHAEKALGTIDDPPLSPQGEQRAQRLAQMFGEPGGIGRLDAVYVTDTRRTQQTAAPLAARLNMTPVVLPANDVAGLAARILREHRGRAVLVLGHSNTVPRLIRELSGIEVPEIPNDEYDNLYVVSVPTFGSASVLRIKY